MRLLSLVVVLVALVAVASANGNFTVTHYFSDGLPFCSQCGPASQYSCSDGLGKWTNKISFKDQTPSTDTINAVTITIQGSYACTYTDNVIQIAVNGVPIDVRELASSNACACNTCDGIVTFSTSFPNGFPNYKYNGADNNITLTLFSGTMCLNVLNATFSYGAPRYPGLQTAYISNSFRDSTSYFVCNGVGFSSSGAINVAFDDPLPKGALLLLADVEVWGSYYCSYTSTISPLVTASIAGTQVGAINAPSGKSSNKCSYKNQCDNGLHLPGSKMYQNGWPNYSYGGKNTLSISTSYSPRIGAVGLTLYYFTPGTNSVLDEMVAAMN